MSLPIKLHYSSSKPNWGDQLSPVICQLISGRPIVHAKPNNCDLMAIGSILDRAKEHFFTKKIHIWGSGFMHPVPPHKTRHHIAAVRGRHTAALLLNAQPQALGDPGLLCDQLLTENITKKHEIGIVPHYSERQNPEIIKFLQLNPQIKFIDIFSSITDFLQDIASCHFILSSSLHGLIAPDSLAIPSIRLKLTDKIKGGDFKFQDYYSIFDIEQPQPIALNDFTPQLINKIATDYQRPNLSQIKKSLIDSFPQI